MGIGDLMKQAQEMQARLKEAQDSLARTRVEGESGAGLVKVTLSGTHEAHRVEIDPSLMKSEEREVLEDLVAAAINDAVRRIEANQKDQMSKFGEGLGLPPGMKLPF
jgi:DNA-binding YbaB/EbfC family protein